MHKILGTFQHHNSLLIALHDVCKFASRANGGTSIWPSKISLGHINSNVQTVWCIALLKVKVLLIYFILFCFKKTKTIEICK